MDQTNDKPSAEPSVLPCADEVVAGTGPIEVSLYGGSGAEWDVYVEAHPEATLYHRYAWRQVLKEALGHDSFYLTAQQQNRIVGILPLTLVKSRLLGASLSSMPFLNYGGVCADHQAARELLYARAVELARQHQTRYLELRNCRRPHGTNPVRLEKATFILHLAETEELTFAALRKATRNRIRKVDEHSLVLKRGLDIIDDFYAGFAVAMKEHGTPVLPRAFFQSVVKHFGDMAIFYVAYKDSDPAGVKLAMIWRDTMYEIWGGYPKEHKARLANYLLSWEATRDAHRMGLKQCDFGRSTRESGPAEFKRHFNCREYQLYWEYPYLATGSLPALSPSNKKYRTAISIWRKLPLSLTKMIGPKLSRYLP